MPPVALLSLSPSSPQHSRFQNSCIFFSCSILSTAPKCNILIYVIQETLIKTVYFYRHLTHTSSSSIHESSLSSSSSSSGNPTQCIIVNVCTRVFHVCVYLQLVSICCSVYTRFYFDIRVHIFFCNSSVVVLSY